MKVLKLSATLALLGSLTLGMAEITIDEQIDAIKSAPAQERVRLMNQFKINLSTLSEAQREEAISQLRTQTQTQTRTRSSENYQQHTENVQQMQYQMQNREQRQIQQQSKQETQNISNSRQR